mmetsp:Transcript_20439/g.37969  ORF Transcript_20439/g.37969 Transcript_20439/m.37969 type:complete len:243 (-) Transcript_20439:79-807(-)
MSTLSLTTVEAKAEDEATGEVGSEAAQTCKLKCRDLGGRKWAMTPRPNASCVGSSSTGTGRNLPAKKGSKWVTWSKGSLPTGGDSSSADFFLYRMPNMEPSRSVSSCSKSISYKKLRNSFCQKKRVLLPVRWGVKSCPYRHTASSGCGERPAPVSPSAPGSIISNSFESSSVLLEGSTLSDLTGTLLAKEGRGALNCRLKSLCMSHLIWGCILLINKHLSLSENRGDLLMNLTARMEACQKR